MRWDAHQLIETNPLMSAHQDLLDRELDIKAGFNFGLFAANKCWVAGVELATASEPPARRPRIWGRRPSGVDPSHPLRCNLLLNFADINSRSRSFQQDMHS